MNSSLFDIFAMIWLLIGDIIAYCALLGAAMTLLFATIDAWRGRSPVRAFKRTADWSIGALTLGILMFVSLMFSTEMEAPATLILGTSRLYVGIMLGTSVVLLMSSLVVSHVIRHKRKISPPQKVQRPLTIRRTSLVKRQ